eukprot:Skav220371  [mRNA]  locus=scaffold609:171467:172144:+ [translate_table: standard]
MPSKSASLSCALNLEPPSRHLLHRLCTRTMVSTDEIQNVQRQAQRVVQGEVAGARSATNQQPKVPESTGLPL